jgi:hypothetical protein
MPKVQRFELSTTDTQVNHMRTPLARMANYLSPTKIIPSPCAIHLSLMSTLLISSSWTTFFDHARFVKTCKLLPHTPTGKPPLHLSITQMDDELLPYDIFDMYHLDLDFNPR